MIPLNNKTNYIFLAEDDIDDQELLIEALTNLDETVEVFAVNNGKKAVTYLEELPENRKPCLIVLDYNLPEMNGAEILNRINDIEKLHPVTKVIWSTSNSPVYEKICTELGAKAYFVKPVDYLGIEQIAKIMLQLCGLKNE